MNNFCAVGRLTSDPEYKKTPNGTSLVRFTLAIDRPFKDKDGNKITDFIPCQAWRQTADYMQQYIHINGGHSGHSINKITTDSAKAIRNTQMIYLSMTVPAICLFSHSPREKGQKQLANSF